MAETMEEASFVCFGGKLPKGITSMTESVEKADAKECVLEKTNDDPENSASAFGRGFRSEELFQ